MVEPATSVSSPPASTKSGSGKTDIMDSLGFEFDFEITK